MWKVAVRVKFRVVEYGSADYEAMVSLRYEILREPLGLSFPTEELESERNDIHVGGFLDGEVCASAMLIREPPALRMRQVAIREDLQGEGIGSELLRYCEEYAVVCGFEEIYCNARDTAILFYRKHGYQPEGEPFEQLTIPHQVLRKRLVP